MKNKVFSFRIKTLVLVLALVIVAAVYYFMVQIPVNNTIAACEDEIAVCEMETMILQSKAIKFNNMKSELEELKKSGNLAELPAYDNLHALINFIDTIVGNKSEYNLSLEDPYLDEKIARRNAVISFVASSYNDACDSIKRLENSPYLCKIDGVSLTPIKDSLNGDSAVKVSMNVVFYEAVGSK